MANKELINHEEKALDPIMIMRQSNQNAVRLGATVSKIDVVEGRPVLNKETKQPIIIEATGEFKTYADKYYVTLDFNGGSIKTEVSKEIYTSLEVGARYLAKGRIASVNVFGENQLLPVFDSFTLLYGNEEF